MNIYAQDMIARDQATFARTAAARAKLAEAIRELADATLDRYEIRGGLAQDKLANIRMASDDTRALVTEVTSETISRFQFAATKK